MGGQIGDTGRPGRGGSGTHQGAGLLRVAGGHVAVLLNRLRLFGLAERLGVKQVVRARNGTMVRLVPEPAEIIDEVPVGRLYRDGTIITRADNRGEGGIMALTALAVKLDSAGPVLFKQVRYGFNNEKIEIYLQFRDFPDPNYNPPNPAYKPEAGRYAMHCHNTVHEDHGMMARCDVVP